MKVTHITFGVSLLFSFGPIHIPLGIVYLEVSHVEGLTFHFLQGSGYSTDSLLPGNDFLHRLVSRFLLESLGGPWDLRSRFTSDHILSYVTGSVPFVVPCLTMGFGLTCFVSWNRSHLPPTTVWNICKVKTRTSVFHSEDLKSNRNSPPLSPFCTLSQNLVLSKSI